MRESVMRAAIDNPLDGITPHSILFGATVPQLGQMPPAASGESASSSRSFMGVVKMASVSSGGNANDYKTARTQTMWVGISLAALAVMVGAILALFG